MQGALVDFHLQDLSSRVLERDGGVTVETLPTSTSTLLKLFKWKEERSSVLRFSPSLYTLVQRTDRTTLKILQMTYNEEVLEELVVQVEEGQGLDASLVEHVVRRLSRGFSVCPGLGEQVGLAGGLAGLLVERYGDSILYRSRTCAR